MKIFFANNLTGPSNQITWIKRYVLIKYDWLNFTQWNDINFQGKTLHIHIFFFYSTTTAKQPKNIVNFSIQSSPSFHLSQHFLNRVNINRFFAEITQKATFVYEYMWLEWVTMVHETSLCFFWWWKKIILPTSFDLQ